MTLAAKQFQFEHNHTLLILDSTIPLHLYCGVDLSNGNKKLEAFDITDYKQCQTYIDSVRKNNNAKVAFGGYLEKRNLYSDTSSFKGDGSQRNIHLGLDFWAEAGTKVITPLDGEVHSFQNNAAIGDYGPTIILEHHLDEFTFHTLYGHLSLESVENLAIGKQFKKGQILAELGTPDINVNYAPHLHFQIIIDMEGKTGDYPGVCSEQTLGFYEQNCPDPNFLLKM